MYDNNNNRSIILNRKWRRRLSLEGKGRGLYARAMSIWSDRFGENGAHMVRAKSRGSPVSYIAETQSRPDDNGRLRAMISISGAEYEYRMCVLANVNDFVVKSYDVKLWRSAWMGARHMMRDHNARASSFSSICALWRAAAFRRSNWIDVNNMMACVRWEGWPRISSATHKHLRTRRQSKTSQPILSRPVKKHAETQTALIGLATRAQSDVTIIYISLFIWIFKDVAAVKVYIKFMSNQIIKDEWERNIQFRSQYPSYLLSFHMLNKCKQTYTIYTTMIS